MAAPRLDIFETLAAIDDRDFEYLNRQPDDLRKTFAPPVVLRWTSAINGPDAAEHIVLVNQIANVNFWDMGDPDMQFRLLASTGSKRYRHQWIAMPGTTKGGGRLEEFLATHWPLANTTELKIILGQFDRTGFGEFVRSAGLDPKDEQDILDAFDRHHGLAPQKKSKNRK